MRVFAFEGQSGAGKTTVACILVRFLRAKGILMRWVNEKEHNPLRSWVVEWHKRTCAERSFSIQDIQEIALARKIVHKNIGAELSSDEILLLDRTVFTSMVYQSSRLVTPEMIWEVNSGHHFLTPEKVFLFIGDPRICFERVLERSKRRSKYGLPASIEDIDQITEIGYKYFQIKSYMPNCVIIDVKLPVKDKIKIILKEIFS